MKTMRTGSLLRTALAVVLAFGLMIPTAALAAEERESTSPEQTLTDSSTFDSVENLSDVPADTSNAAQNDSPATSADEMVADEALADPASVALTTMQAAFPSTFATLSAVTAGPFAVEGGKAASSATATDGDYFYDSSKKSLCILSSTPLTISTPSQTDNNIEIEAGVNADITLAGVTIKNSASPAINLITNINDTADKKPATEGSQILHPTSLYLKLKDGSENTLSAAQGSSAGIRVGEGSILTIDDELDNRLKDGGEAPVEGEKVAADITLVDGTTIAAGTHATVLDSATPGKLTVMGGGFGPGIGGSPYENGGTMTFNGGDLDVRTYGWDFSGEGGESYAAGIGAAGSADGTATVMTFNGGTIKAYGGLHGAGIGAGHSGWDSNVGTQAANSIRTRGSTNCRGKNPNVAGNITINGGYIYSHGGWHGGAFGSACWSSNKGKTIKVTGGTLIPVAGTGAGGAHTGDYSVFPEIGGSGGYVQITGGSVKCSDPSTRFQGIGRTAWGNEAYLLPGYDPNNAKDPNKVSMMTVNLKSEIEKRNNEAVPKITDPNYDDIITTWTLHVAGKDYDYGAPRQFDDGKLYLWLPASAFSQEVSVTLKYIDKNGDEQVIEPLFREPSGAQSGTVLKRYVSFDLPDEFKGSLTKYYDGTALDGLKVSEENPIPTEDHKSLTLQANVSYKYQMFDSVDGEPLGPESTSSSKMPANAGIMKLTIDSNQWSTEPGFSENYWGHRAIGWCNILPTNSKIDLVSATWQEGDDKIDSRQTLTVNATVRKGDVDPDGNPIGPAAQEPHGYIQLYVDGNKVGDPVKMVFAGDTDENGAVVPAGDPRINATRVAEGDGAYTTFQYEFCPAKQDFLVPDATKDNKHEVSVQYLPPTSDDPEPANYLSSVNPADDLEAPRADIVIEPVDPAVSVTSEPDPQAPEGTPIPSFEMDPTPKPTDPDDHPTGDPIYPGDKTYTGSIETIYDVSTPENPYPGRVTLKIRSESSGRIQVVDDESNPFDVDFLRDENGDPIKDDNGEYTLVLDPTGIGKGTLHVFQDPNGAFTGSHWDIDVNVKPDSKIPPETAVSKTVENLTHPEGPTQPGDRLRYTISAVNTATGSAWENVTLSDALPAGLVLDPDTVHLSNPTERFNGTLTAGSPVTLGQYDLSAPGENGRPLLTVMTGDVYGGRGPAVLTFECTVSTDAVGSDISNTAEAQGSRPDPEDPEGPNLPVDTDPSDPVTPPGGGVVRPGDPAISFTKEVTNVTDPTAKTTQVGDVLHYIIVLGNVGDLGTCLFDAVIADPMPMGIEPVPGTLKMTLTNGTEEIAVPDDAYDAETRTIAVSAGDLWGGSSATLTFDATVTKDALGHDNSNIARAHGTLPSGSPDGVPPAGADPGQPVPPPTDEPVQSTLPAEPPVVVGADPDPKADLSAHKSSVNLTRGDGTTHVGDLILYSISVTNSGAATSWMDTAIRDDVPKGLEPMSGTLKMTLPDGTEIPVPDEVYDTGTRVMSVASGHIYGGQTVTLSFEALVIDEAVGADIGNTAYAFGLPPSKWDPDAEHPEPGQAFVPDGGWIDYGRSHDTIESPKVYAPGTDPSVGGTVIPADNKPSDPPFQNTPVDDPPSDEPDGGAITLASTGPVDYSNTIAATRLAKTGDEILHFAIPFAACALVVLASGAAIGRLRRRVQGD